MSVYAAPKGNEEGEAVRLEIVAIANESGGYRWRCLGASADSCGTWFVTKDQARAKQKAWDHAVDHHHAKASA